MQLLVQRQQRRPAHSKTKCPQTLLLRIQQMFTQLLVQHTRNHVVQHLSQYPYSVRGVVRGAAPAVTTHDDLGLPPLQPSARTQVFADRAQRMQRAEIPEPRVKLPDIDDLLAQARLRRDNDQRREEQLSNLHDVESSIRSVAGARQFMEDCQWLHTRECPCMVRTQPGHGSLADPATGSNDWRRMTDNEKWEFESQICARVEAFQEQDLALSERIRVYVRSRSLGTCQLSPVLGQRGGDKTTRPGRQNQ